MALDLNGGLDGNPTIKSGNMDLTGISKNKRIFTFTPNQENLKTTNWEKDKKIWLIAYFDNLTLTDIEQVKQAAILFFRYTMPRDEHRRNSIF